MGDTILTKRFPFARISAAAVLILTEFTIASCLTTGWAAQDPAKPADKQEQAEPAKAKQAGKKPAKEEEEEAAKPKRKVPLRVGDEEMDADPAQSPAKPGRVTPADLGREAERAKHPAVQDLFSRLAKPHDVVTMAQSLRTWNVEPIPEYLAPKAKLSKPLPLQPFNDAWKHGRAFSVTANDIRGVEPYEQLALNNVKEFLDSRLDRDPASKQYLPRLEMLQAAEKALAAVLLFHDSAVERGLRQGNAWSELRISLLAKLQEVQLNQLRALTDLKNWEAAFDLGTRLAEAYPTQKNVQIEIVQQLAKSARESLNDQKYGETHRRLLLLGAQFSNSPELEPIRGELRKRAAKVKDEAEALEKHGDLKGAMDRLAAAKNIYPQLPGLHDFDLRLNKKNPILYVGVRDLPEYFSPARAYLDSEKRAVELLFESLVKTTYSPKTGQRYQPGLAGDLPRLVPLGRQFQLTPGACWSDGRPVTAPDVRRTVQLLSDRDWAGHIPEWANLMERGARIEGDNLHISLTLWQGYLDPLSLMDFKVLPQQLTQADDPGFAKAPLGSGPFRLQGRDEGSVVFVANPYYQTRAGKSGLPNIRAIHFFRSENPANDFREGHLQLLLDLPTQRYKELANLGQVTLQTLSNRRIYFLAVNHRRPPLDNQALRRAIAHAIDRELILNKYFREELTPAPHRPLNGPYPRGSWACNPKVKADPYNPNLAKAQAQRASEARRGFGKLTLKFPEGDPAVAKACEAIQEQVQQLNAGIDLQLIPCKPRDLQRDVEERHDYDLAYYSWDYPDEAYWAWPLFDPLAARPGGRNFLGYQNDDVLESLFRKAMGHRRFAEVQDLTHRIHEVLYERMPFIPLWQLDTHLAIHNSLSMVDGAGRPVSPDPLLIFTNVETWTLDKR